MVLLRASLRKSPVQNAGHTPLTCEMGFLANTETELIEPLPMGQQACLLHGCVAIWLQPSGSCRETHPMAAGKQWTLGDPPRRSMTTHVPGDRHVVYSSMISPREHALGTSGDGLAKASGLLY